MRNVSDFASNVQFLIQFINPWQNYFLNLKYVVFSKSCNIDCMDTVGFGGNQTLLRVGISIGDIAAAIELKSLSQ